MCEKVKAAPMLQHQGGEGGQLTIDEVRLPEVDSTTTYSVAQGISTMLLPGEKNVISLQDLARITGLNTREVRRRIRKERLAGIPILSNCQAGYFLASTRDERDRCARSMFARAEEVRRTAQAIAAAEVPDG